MEAEPRGVERDGFAIPMTLFSLLRPGCKYVQKTVFVAGMRRRTQAIDDLGFIHFARLTVITRFPQFGQPRDRLYQALQLFESNYNGTFGEYIDTFVQAIKLEMRYFWGTSYGFPFRLPFGPFKRYIEANEFPIDHYYVRNPAASVKMVDSARRVVKAHEELLMHAPDLSPQEFAEHFRRVVTGLQKSL
jgi:hypothetical protein